MKTLLITTALLLSTTGAQALTQKVELDLNNSILRGQQRVPLKRMLRRSLGRQMTQGWKVTKVEVEAKSKKGLGEISLLVNGSESPIKTVPGTEENFDSDYSGFTTITLNAPHVYRGQEGRGPIALLTSGLVKLDDVYITLKKELRYDYHNTLGMLFTRKVEFKAQKVVGSDRTISVNARLAGIKLVGTKRSVSVNKVEIEFMDGQKVIVDELDGKLKEGREKNFALRGPLAKPVRRIKVGATSRSLFGSRGKLAVELAL